MFVPLVIPRRMLRALFGAVAVASLGAGASGAAARTLAAQDVPNRESALEVRANFMKDLDSLQVKFVALATAIPAEKYSWRPMPGVRSIGEAFMHVASEYYVFTPMAYGAARSPVIPPGPANFPKFEASSTKADVMKHLVEGFAYMRGKIMELEPAAITGTKKLFGGDRTIVETSFVMSGDLHEHLGQLVSYARMNEIKPPWSK